MDIHTMLILYRQKACLDVRAGFRRRLTRQEGLRTQLACCVVQQAYEDRMTQLGGIKKN